MPAATIDTLEIAIQVQSDDAERRLDRFLEKLRAISSATNSRGTVSARIRDITPDTAGLDTASKKVKRIGDAAASSGSKISQFSRDLRESGNAANRGASGLLKFWESLKRVAYMRAVRAVLRTITSALREGVNNMYTWSQTTGNTFASTMDSLATSANYLKNSLGAMAAPLLNALAPALNTIIDLVVEAINALNMMISAFSGADTYTVAVRTATSWGGAVSNAASNASNAVSNAVDDMKRTIMGFDEINKLSKDIGNSSGDGSGSGSSSGSGAGGGIAFEERPLEGIWEKISDITSGMPDWLKWLFGGTALVGGFLLIKKFIPWLLEKIGDLFAIKIPDWIKWLFGPKDDGEPKIDIPDHIDIPDGKVKVDVEKGDWSALDEITGKSVYVSPKLDNQGGVLFDKFKDEWDAARTPLYVSPKLDNTGAVLWNGMKSEWDDAGSKTLYFSPKLDNGADTLYKNFKAEWDAQGSKALYFSPKLDNTAQTIYNAFKKEWDSAGSTILYLSPKLDNTGTVLWNGFKGEWDAAKSTLYASPKLDNTASVLWAAFKKEWDSAAETLKVKVELDYSGTDGFGGATGGGGSTSGSGAGRTIKMTVEPETTVGGKTFWERAKEAIDAAGTAVDKGLDVIVRPALNSAGEKITSIVQWLFGSNTAPEVTTMVNASAGTGFSGLTGNKFTIGGVNDTSTKVNASAGTGFSKMTGNTFTIGGITDGNVTVNGTPGTGFAGKLSGTNKYTLAGIESATVDVKSKLTGATTDSKTNTQVHGSKPLKKSG